MVSGEFGVVEWTPGWEDNFDQLAGRLLVPPVVRSLLYSQARRARVAYSGVLYLETSYKAHDIFSAFSLRKFGTLLPGPSFGARVGRYDLSQVGL
jgi:hypothetical protein